MCLLQEYSIGIFKYGVVHALFLFMPFHWFILISQFLYNGNYISSNNHILSVVMVVLKCCLVLRMTEMFVFLFPCKNCHGEHFSADTLAQLICYWDLSTFQPLMCKHFVSAIYVIRKVLNTRLKANFAKPSAEHISEKS